MASEKIEHTPTLVDDLRAQASRIFAEWGDDCLETQAADLIDELLEVLRLYDVYDAMPSDRGGKNGPRGRAYQAFVDAKRAAISKATGAS